MAPTWDVGLLKSAQGGWQLASSSALLHLIRRRSAMVGPSLEDFAWSIYQPSFSPPRVFDEALMNLNDKIMHNLC